MSVAKVAKEIGISVSENANVQTILVVAFVGYIAYKFIGVAADKAASIAKSAAEAVSAGADVVSSKVADVAESVTGQNQSAIDSSTHYVYPQGLGETISEPSYIKDYGNTSAEFDTTTVPSSWWESIGDAISTTN